MRELVIQPENEKKGRSFRATCVAAIKADGLISENEHTIRPVWAMFAGSEQELRPFVANLRLGKKAILASDLHRSRGGGERFEFLRSIGYHCAWQREAEGSIVTLYHPSLFRLDPGMVDPDGISFVIVVPKHWTAQQRIDTAAAVAHALKLELPVSEAALAELVPTAYLFAAYLDRRTRCPLIADGRFYLQMLCAALDEGAASLPADNLRWTRGKWGVHQRFGFGAEGLADVGVLHAIAFNATHQQFEEFIAEQVALYFRRVGARAKVGRRAPAANQETHHNG